MKNPTLLLAVIAFVSLATCKQDKDFPDRKANGEVTLDSLARRAGGIGDDQGRGIVVDKAGNIYIVGNFEGTATFDNITVTSAGNQDGFFVKYDPEGKIIWVKVFGEQFSDSVQDIVLDQNENVYISGFIREANTSGFQARVTSFITKYDPTGTILWTKKSSSEDGYVIAESIAIDGIGNVFISGVLFRKVFFGNEEINSQNPDLFLVKYSNTGTFQWVKVTNGVWQNGSSIAADKDGNSYICWTLQQEAKLENITIKPDGDSDMFVAKYNPNGSMLWIRNAGGSGGIVAKGVACDNNGGVYCTGELSRSAKFGNSTVNAKGKRDIFISKMNTDGDFQWTKTIGGDWDDLGSAISLNEKGEVYVAGYSYNFAIRYGINLPRIPDPSLGSSDLLIAKYTSNGTLLWTKKDGGIYEDFVGGLTVSNSGNIYIAGSFDTTTTLTGDTLTAPINPRNYYNTDIFFVRYKE